LLRHVESVIIRNVCAAGRVLTVVIALALTLSALRTAAAGDWPKDYIVHENSESADGRYAVLVQSQDAALAEDDNESAVYLADTKAHATLGEIGKVDYFEHQNHRHLEVFWAPDSSFCVVENDGRYGADTISILEIRDSSFVQTEIGERIQKSLDGAMKKQAHDSEMSGYVSPYFRLGTDQKIRVRALSENNPKGFDNVKTYYALFQGTFDIESKKWTATDVRSINSEQNDALQSAYQNNFAKHMIVAADSAQTPENFTGSVFSSEEQKADALDKMMNDVYQAVRYILPANRFAKVKQEQVAWLKTRDAAHSVEEKSKLTESRIKTLQDLLW
jgi:uncharacterized protein YecT (DUF1311 family)